MNCERCDNRNEATRWFCDACGAALVSACPECGAQNRPTVRFCGDCGTALGVRQTSRATTGSTLASEAV